MSIREYSRSHIQEYKGLKPKEVDQSKIIIMHPERQQQLQRSKYVYTRILEKTESQPTKQKKTHTNSITFSHRELRNSMTTLTKEVS